MTAEEATKLAGSAPDYHTQELFDSIESGNYPTYLVYVQVMTPDQAKETTLDIFDDTYTWPHKDYPLRLVGRMTLNRNVRRPHAMHRHVLTYSAGELLRRHRTSLFLTLEHGPRRWSIS